MSARGFTLIELVVVIGVIIVLAALTLSASVSVMAGSEVRQTDMTLRLLDTAVKEWQTSTDRRITWGDDGGTATYHVQWDTPHVFNITEVLEAVRRTDGVRAVIARIDRDFLHRYETDDPPPPWLSGTGADDPDPNASAASSYFNGNDLNGRSLDGTLCVLDAWGTPIRVIHPGRPAEPAFNGLVDDDGTVRVVDEPALEMSGQEQYYGVARNREICFVSAGPDGKFGNLTMCDFDSAAMLCEQTRDNVYSYAPLDPVVP